MNDALTFFSSPNAHIGLQGIITGLSLVVALGPQSMLLLRQGIRREALVPIFLICLLGDLLLLPAGTFIVGVAASALPMLMIPLKVGGVIFLLWFGWNCWKSSLNPTSFQLAPATQKAQKGPKPQKLRNKLNPHSTPGAYVQPETQHSRTVYASQVVVSPGGGAGALLTSRGVSQPAAAREHTSSHVATHPVQVLPVPEPAPVAPVAEVTEKIASNRKLMAAAWLTPPIIGALTTTFLNPTTYLDTVVMLGSISNQFGEVGRWWFTAGAMVASMIWFPTITFGARVLARPLSNPTISMWMDRAIACLMVFMAVRLALT